MAAGCSVYRREKERQQDERETKKDSNIRIVRQREREKEKGYTKLRDGRGATREQERAPWKQTCKMVYEESRGGGGRVAAPSCSCRFRRPHVRARGPRARARARAGPDVGVLFLILSLSLYLSLSVSPFRPGLTRACSPARRCRGARQHSLTRNCTARRRRAYFRATETLRAFRFSPRPFFIDLELIYGINLQMAKIEWLNTTS